MKKITITAVGRMSHDAATFKNADKTPRKGRKPHKTQKRFRLKTHDLQCQPTGTLSHAQASLQHQTPKLWHRLSHLSTRIRTKSAF